MKAQSHPVAHRSIACARGRLPDAVVTSARNPRVKAVLALRKRRNRDAEGRFVAEGVWSVRMALRAGVHPLEVFYCPDLLRPGNEVLLAGARAAGARIVQTGEAAFRRMSYRDDPDGMLAIVRSFPTSLDHLAVGTAPLLLVVETIEKPGNLGAIFRTACAANADGVIVCEPQTDPFSPGVVRASLGTLFMARFAIGTTDEAIAWLGARGIRTVAATPSATRVHWETDLGRPVAIVIGNEHRGLSDAWLRGSSETVRIPMPGAVDSLNATTAAGILLFEALRQGGRARGV